MNRLEAQFGDQIQFILLDVDDPDSLPLRQQHNMIQRSAYALVDANGEVVQRWFGALNADSVSADLAAFLAEGG
ncbi:MAG: hypothetical protein AAF125_13865 [Chloroflexota bacterium]